MWQDAAELDQTSPMQRQYAMLRESRLEEPMAVSSSRAIVLAARRLVCVLQTNGPHAIALWLSPRTAREAKHLATRFARKALRTARLFTDSVEACAALDRGEVRAVWLFGSDTAVLALRSRRTLASADCVILQDHAFPVGKSASDVFFPVQRSEADDDADARPAWWWVQQVALAMGFREGFAFTSQEQIRAEITRGTLA